MTRQTGNWFLKPLQAEDESWMWEMLYQAIYVPVGEPLPDRSILQQPELARYVRGWGRKGDLGAAAFSALETQPIGAAWLRLWEPAERGYGWAADDIPELSIAILPSWRGFGIGTALLESVFDAARPIFHALSLSVSADNPAFHLYERMGFAPLIREGDSIVMLKKLILD